MKMKKSLHVVLTCAVLGICGCGATEGIVADAARQAAVEIIEEVIDAAEQRVIERFLGEEATPDPETP